MRHERAREPRLFAGAFRYEPSAELPAVVAEADHLQERGRIGKDNLERPSAVGAADLKVKFPSADIIVDAAPVTMT